MHACAVVAACVVGAGSAAGSAAPVVDSTMSDSREGTDQRERLALPRPRRVRSKATRSSTRTRSWSSRTSSASSRRATSSSRRGTTGSRPTAPTSTPKTRLGTFYNAYGIATVQPPRQSAEPGGVAPPPMAGQETVVYFFGETSRRSGRKKYKITNGGFSTCVQPTPRWDLHRRHGHPEHRSLHAS